MGEIAGWIEENKPKRKSWLQKIRDYDRLELALTEALRDRDFHAHVADLWQGKLIKANMRILELEKELKK